MAAHSPHTLEPRSNLPDGMRAARALADLGNASGGRFRTKIPCPGFNEDKGFNPSWATNGKERLRSRQRVEDRIATIRKGFREVVESGVTTFVAATLAFQRIRGAADFNTPAGARRVVVALNRGVTQFCRRRGLPMGRLASIEASALEGVHAHLLIAVSPRHAKALREYLRSRTEALVGVTLTKSALKFEGRYHLIGQDQARGWALYCCKTAVATGDRISDVRGPAHRAHGRLEALDGQAIYHAFHDAPEPAVVTARPQCRKARAASPRRREVARTRPQESATATVPALTAPQDGRSRPVAALRPAQERQPRPSASAPRGGTRKAPGPTLPPSSAALLGWLRSCADATGWASFGVGHMATVLGANERTIRRGLRALEAADLLRTQLCRGEASIFHLAPEPTIPAPVGTAKPDREAISGVTPCLSKVHNDTDD